MANTQAIREQCVAIQNAVAAILSQLNEQPPAPVDNRPVVTNPRQVKSHCIVRLSGNITKDWTNAIADVEDVLIEGTNNCVVTHKDDCFFVIRSKNVTIRNISFKGLPGPKDPNDPYSPRWPNAVATADSDNITVENCIFLDNGNGIHMGPWAMKGPLYIRNCKAPDASVLRTSGSGVHGYFCWLEGGHDVYVDGVQIARVGLHNFRGGCRKFTCTNSQITNNAGLTTLGIFPEEFDIHDNVLTKGDICLNSGKGVFKRNRIVGTCLKVQGKCNGVEVANNTWDAPEVDPRWRLQILQQAANVNVHDNVGLT